MGNHNTALTIGQLDQTPGGIDTDRLNEILDQILLELDIAHFIEQRDRFCRCHRLGMRPGRYQ